MNCSNCHKEINADAKFCKFCGAKTKNFENKIQTIDKDSKIKTVLLLFFIFVSVAETVFIGLSFYDLKNINKISDDFLPSKDSTSSVSSQKSFVNAFGSKINLTDEFNYEFYQGKLILNKNNAWHIVAISLLYNFNTYSVQIENIKTRLQINNYVIENNELKEMFGKERIIFNLSKNEEKTALIITPIKNNKTLIYELYSDNGIKEEYIDETIKLFDEANDLDKILEPKNSLILSDFINK